MGITYLRVTVSLEQVSSFVYLGATFKEDGICPPEIRKRLAMGRSVMQSLSKIWKSKQVTGYTKVRLVTALVWSVATYGSEGWIIHKAEEKQIEAFEMWCYRKVLRVSWTYHRTNEWVLLRLEVKKSLLAHIGKLKLSYYGHNILYYMYYNEESKLFREGQHIGLRSREQR